MRRVRVASENMPFSAPGIAVGARTLSLPMRNPLFTACLALCALPSAALALAPQSNPNGNALTGANMPAQAAPTEAGAPPVDATGLIDSLPPIKVTPEVLDLGFMAPKAGGKGTVQLLNTGDKPLKIAAVTPSCKCTTTSQMAGTVIEPGKSVPLEAVLEGAAMPQPHRASIRVLVDGYAKVLEIQLRGETAMPLRSVPGLINAVEDKPRQGRFVVESLDKKPFTICAMAGRVPDLIGWQPGDAPRNSYLVRFDLDSYQPTFPAFLVLETDRADCPVLNIWVRSRDTMRQSVLRMKEYEVNLGRIAMGGTAEASVEMEDPGEEILAIESISPELQAEMTGQTADGKIRKVSFRITPKGPQQGLLYGKIKLYTREKEQPLIVFGSVRPEGATGCVGCRADRPDAPAAPAAPVQPAPATK